MELLVVQSPNAAHYFPSTLIFFNPLLLKLQIESNRALRLVLSSPEIDLLRCLPLPALEPATANGDILDGDGMGGADGGGSGDEPLPPLSVA